MNKIRKKIPRVITLRERRRDPRYASAMTWNWQVCNDCGKLVSLCCPQCGGVSFNQRPRDVMRAALDKHGYPPALFRNTEPKSGLGR